jgi:uncharacterized protein
LIAGEEAPMTEGELLRIHLGEQDRGAGHALFESVVLAAREAGLAGATVLRGPLGYGRSSRLHTSRILDLSVDLPVIIEIVDTAERIAAFLPRLRELVTDNLITLERVRIVQGGRVPGTE